MQSDCSNQDLKAFIQSLGFNDFSLELVTVAFTHSSFTQENNESYLKCYERLEFLGDAVLKMATTEYLYNHFPEETEGKLTKIRSVIVSDEVLHKVAQKINIEPYIKVASHEFKNNIHKLESVQACIMEALFGALYLSSEKEKLKQFIINELKELIDELAQEKTVYNAKALLQEYTQGESKTLPVYNTINESGAAHNKTFTVQVLYKDKELAQAQGKTKKQAQQEAAFIACKKLGLISEEQSQNEQ